MPRRPARHIHESLLEALSALRRAEQNAVLLFAELLKHRLYRDLGYATIHLYASEALGFSRRKTYQFIRLANSLEQLPELKASIKKNDLPWTKARVIADLATPKTQKRWIAEARKSSRRELERKARLARAKTKSGIEQPALELGPKDDLPAAPVDIRLRFTPEQISRFEAIIEVFRKRGRNAAREDLILEALDSLLGDEECTRVHSSSSYQIIAYRCDECGRTSLKTSRGNLRIDKARTEVISCDSKTLTHGTNRSSIAPTLRARVLARDGHRCSTPGCRHRHFLEVHHKKPRSRGGGDQIDNLITLCSACHQQAHR